MARRIWIGAAIAAVVAAVAIAILGWPGRGGRSGTARNATTTDGSGSARGAGAGGAATLAPFIRDPEPSGALRLEGLVVDAADRPVAGATVEVSARPARTAVSDRDGSFAIDGLLPRTYTISARAGDRYADRVDVPLRETTEPLTLRLHAGTTIAIRAIADVDERPIAGAAVSEDDQTAVTGADGVATLPGAGPWFHSVTVRADGFAPAQLSFTFGADPGGRIEHTVRLHTGAALAGTVVDPDGKPIAGARVEASRDDGGADTTSDGAGAWRLPALAAGAYQLTATADGFAVVVVERVLDGVTATDGVVLRLERGRRLTGTVVDAGGAPLGQASITAAIGPGDRRHATSDADGRFAITGLPAAPLRVYAIHGATASPAAEVALGAGDGEVRLQMTAATIAGVVVDERGAPLPEIRVSAMPTQHELLVFGHAVTDATGRFETGPLPAGAYRLEAAWPEETDANRYLNIKRDAPTAASGARDARIVLAGFGAVTGTVTLDGAPVPYFGLAINSFEPGLAFSEPEVFRALDGRFKRPAVPAGTWVIAFVGPDFARHVLTDVVVAPGAATDLGTIAVERGFGLDGRVVDDAGRPVAGATVALGQRLTSIDRARDNTALKNALDGLRLTTSGADGGFTITGVAAPHPRQGHAVIAVKASRTSPAVPVTLPAPPVTLTVEATGTLTGTVRNAPGPERIIVRITAAAGGPAAMAMVENGRFRAERLRPGTYHLAAAVITRDDDGPAAEADIEIRADATATVELVFPASPPAPAPSPPR